MAGRASPRPGRKKGRPDGMLFRKDILARIATGDVTMAFRRWKRPTVRAGGTLRTPVGVLAIDAVERVARIPLAEAGAAGAGSLEELLAGLRDDGELYRVRFHLAGPDDRLALRESTRDIAETLGSLEALDAREAWTRDCLRLIERNPGVRAARLASDAGLPTATFKARVRRLKDLGLTESLATGYRISARGAEVLRRSSGS